MNRIFISSDQITDDSILELSSSNYHYIFNVLRLQIGSKLSLIVDQKLNLIVKIKHIKEDNVFFEKQEEIVVDIEPICISLIQALPKQDKFSEILKACTEIGVSNFVPLITSRVVLNLKQVDREKKQLRWSKILTSAAQQSKRNLMPTLNPIVDLKKLINNEVLLVDLNAYDLKLVFWEDERNNSLKDILRKASSKWGDFLRQIRIAVCVGPEGGFSRREVSQLEELGFISVSLGKFILRVEHAGLVACSNIFYEINL